MVDHNRSDQIDPAAMQVHALVCQIAAADSPKYLLNAILPIEGSKGAYGVLYFVPIVLE